MGLSFEDFGMVVEIRWKTNWHPLTALFRSSSLVKSPSHHSIPSRRETGIAIASLGRSKIRTSWPASNNALVRWDPIKPPPPRIKHFNGNFSPKIQNASHSQ